MTVPEARVHTRFSGVAVGSPPAAQNLPVCPRNSAISIELYYIFATVWGHKLYTLYGILLIVFAILVIVTSFITVALTYFQLSVEDYRWWWRSIMNGGYARGTHRHRHGEGSGSGEQGRVSRVGRAGSGERGRASRVGRAGSGEQGRASRVGRWHGCLGGWRPSDVEPALATVPCLTLQPADPLPALQPGRSPPGPAAGPIPARPCSPPILCQNPAARPSSVRTLPLPPCHPDHFGIFGGRV